MKHKTHPWLLMQSRQPHLALTVKERKFAKRLGWNLQTSHPRKASEWFIYRPDGSSCGFLCGFSEIRRLRTLSFL